ncbi:MAG: hypothetical protein LBJ12_07380 [Oscillospiraceae bacterium]|jgi:hypothetical protein|nr:hypothetical protein [Oscillospiraceae bacterium]
MKKITGLFLVLALALGLAACVTSPGHDNPTTSEGETLSTKPIVTNPSDPVDNTVTMPTDIVTEPPVEVTPAPTTTAQQQSNVTTTKPKPTEAPKATLYPASNLYKYLKSGNFYMELAYTGSATDQNGKKQKVEMSLVRAADGDKQYLKMFVEGKNVALLTDKAGMTMLLPASLLSGGSGFDIFNIGKNTGLAIKIDNSGASGVMGFDLSEFDDTFLDVGTFQGASEATYGNKKYKVETFKSKSGNTNKVYFLSGSSDVSLVQSISANGDSMLASITVLKEKAESKYFKVPFGYVSGTIEQLQKLFGG